MVVLADSGTLAELYGKLTGEPATDAWSRFTAAVGALSVGVTSDDSFGALTKIGTSPTTPGQSAAHWLGRAGAPPLEPFPGSGPAPDLFRRTNHQFQARFVRSDMSNRPVQRVDPTAVW
jgi:hypothetical protein